MHFLLSDTVETILKHFISDVRLSPNDTSCIPLDTGLIIIEVHVDYRTLIYALIIICIRFIIIIIIISSWG